MRDEDADRQGRRRSPARRRRPATRSRSRAPRAASGRFTVGVDDDRRRHLETTEPSGAETTVRRRHRRRARARRYPDGETIALHAGARPALGHVRPGGRPASCARRPAAVRRSRPATRAVDAGRRRPIRCRSRTLTDTFTTNGHAYTVTYDAADAHADGDHPAEGRTTRTTLRRQGPRDELDAGPGVDADHLRVRRRAGC